MTDLTTAHGVLAELVALQDIYDRGAPMVDSAAIYADYERRKPIAWAAARAVVAKPQPDERELFEIWVRKHYVDFAAFIEFEVWKERATR